MNTSTHKTDGTYRLVNQDSTPANRLVSLALEVRDDLATVVERERLTGKARADVLRREGIHRDAFRDHVRDLLPKPGLPEHNTTQPISLTLAGPSPRTVLAFPGAEIYNTDQTQIHQVWIDCGANTYYPAVLKQAGSALDAPERIARERDIAAHLIHLNPPNSLVAPLAVCLEGIVYAFIPGPENEADLNLATAMRTKALTQLQWLAAMKEVAESLGWLHQHRLMYLDVSDTNIFLDRGMRARLGDFASVRHYSHVIDPQRDGGFISNGKYYDPRVIIEQQRLRDALDIADKIALGRLILEGLEQFGINAARSSPGAQKLIHLGKMLTQAHNHPRPRLREGIDQNYYSWHSIVRRLTVG